MGSAGTGALASRSSPPGTPGFIHGITRLDAGDSNTLGIGSIAALAASAARTGASRAGSGAVDTESAGGGAVGHSMGATAGHVRAGDDRADFHELPQHLLALSSGSAGDSLSFAEGFEGGAGPGASTPTLTAAGRYAGVAESGTFSGGLQELAASEALADGQPDVLGHGGHHSGDAELAAHHISLNNSDVSNNAPLGCIGAASVAAEAGSAPGLTAGRSHNGSNGRRSPARTQVSSTVLAVCLVARWHPARV